MLKLIKRNRRLYLLLMKIHVGLIYIRCNIGKSRSETLFKSLRLVLELLEVKDYKVNSIKQYAVDNSQIHVLEDEKASEVFAPEYFMLSKGTSTSVRNPEIYITNLKNVEIVGGNSLILFENLCLNDMIFFDEKNRFDLRFNSVKYIDKESAIVTYIKSNNVIEKGIFLIGFASYNYYHLTVEIIARLNFIEAHTKDKKIPLLVDKVVLETPQYRELLEKFNVYKRDILLIENNYKYMVKELIYCSDVAWMPINVKKDVKLEPQDSMICKKNIQNIRSLIMNNSNNCGDKKIFISRRNTKNVRLVNEGEILELFKKYGFDIVYPEELSFKEQVKLFGSSQIIAGVSGAGFTNTIYAHKDATVICIIPKEYNFFIYSTISKVLGLKSIYLNPSIIERKNVISEECYEMDLDYCELFLKSL